MIKKTTLSFLNASKFFKKKICCTEVCLSEQTSCAQSATTKFMHFDIKIKINKLFKNRYFSRFLFFSWVFCFFMVLGVFANVNYISNSVYSNYSAGEKIKGNVYLTFANHSANSLFTSNFAGNITLLNFIKNHSGFVEGISYNCSTIGCVNDYSSSGLIGSLSLSAGQESFAGFGVNGVGISITNAKLRVISNAPASCSPNLYVDVLGDDLDLITNTESSGESCGLRYTGCYDQSNNLEANISTGKEYCEKIDIPAAPSFIVGGEIRIGTGPSNLTMKLYDVLEGDSVGTCKLPQHSPAGGLQDLSCVINHSASSTKSYYVCISTSINNSNKIGWETSGPTCGTAQGFNSLNSDFDLFAETRKYSSSPNFVINDTKYLDMFGVRLSDALDNYMLSRYNRNCQNGPCFMPIKIYGENQIVSFNDVKLNYDSVGIEFDNQDIYGLTYSSAKINAVNLSLNLSKADFIIPVDSSEDKFKLYLDGSQLFQKDISVRRSFAFDVNPKVVTFGQNLKFKATSATTNITSSTWNFGDGTAQQTVNGSEIFHSYTARNSSSFDLTVTVRNNQSLQATKQFKIFVGNPKDIANQTIYEYRRRIVNLTSQINSYPAWVIPRIQNTLKLSNLTSKINSIEQKYISSIDESDFQDIMIDLINLDVPVSIITSSSGEKIPLSAGYENININYLEQIENKNLEDDTKLAEQVVAWMGDNFNAEISFRKIARVGDFDTEPFVTLFTINTNPINSINKDTYLILGQDIEKSGVYKTNYNIKSINAIGIDYIVLDTSVNQVFDFVIDGDIEAENLGAYIAPSLELITSVVGPSAECKINNICEDDETADNCPEDCSKKWFKFTIVSWIVLVIVGFVCYIILQEWYKKNYKSRLFPENNDLYNLVNFIYNARKTGLSDGEIRSKLKQQRWSSERLTFAFRKIEGKRVMMFEIPLFTRKEHKETVTQISNRQKSPLDARFIKRPSF